MCTVFDVDGNAIFSRISTANCEFVRSRWIERYQCVQNEIYFLNMLTVQRARYLILYYKKRDCEF